MCLEELRRCRAELENSLNELQKDGRELDARSEKTFANMREIANESLRVADVARDAPKILDDLDAEFEEKTGLNGIDIAFLFLAVALQCARQYILSNDKFRITSTEGDRLVKRVTPKNWHDILTQSVPYDAIVRGDDMLSTGLGGTTHRYRTLGHDPIMGWIFGTMNILSDSLTKYNVMESYAVAMPGMVITGPIPTTQVFIDGFAEIKNDKYNLPAAVLRQAIHFGSDYFTKQGLPLPFISTVNNDAARELITKFNIDMWGVTRGAAVAVLINSLIACAHQLFYDPNEYSSHKLYEVKTRKILSYSNLIASASNLIYVAVSKDLPKLDVGGILVTLYRVITDIKFKHQLKREFIMESFNEMIRGKEYSFEQSS